MNRSPIKDVLGYDVCTLDIESIIDILVENVANRGQSKSVMCANPHSLVVASKNKKFQEALHSADLLIPDGIGVVLASRLGGNGVTRRVTGTDLFQRLMYRLNKDTTYSCFFLGSSEQTLETIREKMAIEYPNVSVAGTWSPPFREKFDSDDHSQMTLAVNASAPDILWVGLTAPKQEIFIYEALPHLNVRVVGAIGAVFDFFAESTPRPGRLARHLGLEWLVRFLREPRRLWRRTFLSAPKFLKLIIDHRRQPDPNST